MLEDSRNKICTVESRTAKLRKGGRNFALKGKRGVDLYTVDLLSKKFEISSLKAEKKSKTRKPMFTLQSYSGIPPEKTGSHTETNKKKKRVRTVREKSKKKKLELEEVVHLIIFVEEASHAHPLRDDTILPGT